MPPIRSSLLDAAARLGDKLCTTAYWHEGLCNWIGRSAKEMTEPGLPLVPTVSALGPELYGGTAGVALFLSQLFAKTGNLDARKTAEGAVRHALWHGSKLPQQTGISFYSGQIGIAYASVRVGRLLEQHELELQGLQMLHQAITRPADHDKPLDVIGGHAGAIAALLWLSGATGNRSLHDSAIQHASELAGAAIRRDGTWCWDPEQASGKGLGTTPLCGFAHGASGMGLALLEAGVKTGREDWVDGGLAAFAYEDGLYDDEQQNWPDLRTFTSVAPLPEPSTRPFMVAWCHGAAGIALARLRALQLLPRHRAQLLIGAERAIRKTEAVLNALPPESDASLCHGRAGLADVLLYASEVLLNQTYVHRVKNMWRRVLVARAGNDDWPSGVASGRGSPSLMLGDAGIGYGLLRAQYPAKVSSILLVTP